MSIEEALAYIPNGWQVMALSEDSERGYYCCLRTRQPTNPDAYKNDHHYPCAVSYGRDWVEAIEGAIKSARKVGAQ